ncbi:MAG: hypothetical protein LBD48_04295 [Treponema sp.]|jgi:hypothetical protein|nr:hypothetical protein [Treponema sp.]
MKKFIITVCILLVLAGLAFFFGWAQLKVPPGAYGIVRSKTHGVDPRPVRSGEFRWIWYKLIPSNVEIAVYRIVPVTRSISARNSLPSGKTYADFAGIDGGFSWTINASLSFSLNPALLVSVVTDNNIGSAEEFTRYEKDLAGQIEAAILRRLNSGEEDAALLEELLGSGSSPEFNQSIQAEFPQVSGFSFTVTSADFPDIALYRQVRSLYESFILRQREMVSGTLYQKAENMVNSKLRFEELEQYGALLTRYPILLEYLAIEAKSDTSR